VIPWRAGSNGLRRKSWPGTLAGALDRLAQQLLAALKDQRSVPAYTGAMPGGKDGVGIYSGQLSS